MPSKRPQLNVRLTTENRARLEALRASMRAALNIDVSQADVIGAALAHLEKLYPPIPGQPPPDVAPEAKKRGRRKKDDAP